MAATGFTRFICLFHDAARGRGALDALTGAGFSRDSITTVGGTDNGLADTETSSTLDQLGIPDRDLTHLRDGLRNGGMLVTLEAPEARSADIERVFSKFSADKIDEADLGAAPAFADATASDSAAIPVVQEDLLVGKREVDRGGVRVFRRVVEEPVSESLNLHQERVIIDRRPVDRAVSNADLSAGDQVIELTETDEVPVVTKTSRVVEEVRVGLQESDRTEVIEDTVRHTEVDVEQLPSTTRTTTRP